MSEKETHAYTDEDIEEWVQRDVDWDKIKRWQSYILGRRQSYLHDRQRAMGAEYFSNASQWDMVFEREWMVFEERLKGGIGVDDSLLNELGEDFFDTKQYLLDEINSIHDEFDSEQIDEDKTVKVYTLEDFIMLSNQGIFRDTIFILDPQRKWRKKVEDIVRTYGYNYTERIKIGGVNYLVVSQEEN